MAAFTRHENTSSAHGAFTSGHGAAQGSGRDAIPAGSRNRWPRCSARTRAGTPCRAAGSGLGGRCRNHGGLSQRIRDAHDRLVFFGVAPFGSRPWRGELVRSLRQPWAVCVIPSWLAAQLPETAFLERELCEHALRTGKYRWRTGRVAEGAHLARRWPQAIGFRPALLLLERGRVSHGVFALDADITRWTRARRPFESDGPPLVRVEAGELLEAIRESGGRIVERRGAAE